MKIECPYIVNKDVEFNCKLNLTPSNELFIIRINYGNGSYDVLSNISNYIEIPLIYSSNETHTIHCEDINGILSVNHIIFGRKKTNSLILTQP